MPQFNNASSSESAPAYDDIFAGHPVNQNPQPRVPKAYAAVPQQDYDHSHHQEDSEMHNHNDIDMEANAGSASDTPLQTVVCGSRPHTHCEVCDRIAHRREEHDQQKHCCAMVALVFIVAFICLMISASVWAGKRK